MRDWIESYLDRLYGFAFALTHDPDQSRDLVQECVVRALAASRSPVDEPARRAWLFRILRNIFIDGCRRLHPEVVLDPGDDSLPTDDECGWRGDRRVIDVVTVHVAMSRLPAAQREIIALVDFVGLSYHEVADVMGIAEGTVMSRLSRARRRLLDALQEGNVTSLAQARERRR